MSAIPSEAVPREVPLPVVPVEPVRIPPDEVDLGERFLQFTAIVAGVVLGAIAAFIVAAAFGWISLQLC